MAQSFNWETRILRDQVRDQGLNCTGCKKSLQKHSMCYTLIKTKQPFCYKCCCVVNNKLSQSIISKSKVSKNNPAPIITAQQSSWRSGEVGGHANGYPCSQCKKLIPNGGTYWTQNAVCLCDQCHTTMQHSVKPPKGNNTYSMHTSTGGNDTCDDCGNKVIKGHVWWCKGTSLLCDPCYLKKTAVVRRAFQLRATTSVKPSKLYPSHIGKPAQNMGGLSLPPNSGKPFSKWQRRVVRKSCVCENCGHRSNRSDIVGKHMPSHKTFRCLKCDVATKKGLLPTQPTWKHGLGQSTRPTNLVSKTFQGVVGRTLQANAGMPAENDNWFDLGPAPEKEQVPCFGFPNYESRIAPVLEKWMKYLNTRFPSQGTGSYVVHAEAKEGGCKEISIRLYYTETSADWAQKVVDSLPKTWDEPYAKTEPSSDHQTNPYGIQWDDMKF